MKTTEKELAERISRAIESYFDMMGRWGSTLLVERISDTRLFIMVDGCRIEIKVSRRPVLSE